MKSRIISAFLYVMFILSSLAITDVYGHVPKDKLLNQAQSRMIDVYDHGQFRAKGFRADWLDDSSGYTVTEQVNGTNVKVRYDAATGKRTVIDSTDNNNTRKSPNISPDGSREFYRENGNLYIRNLKTKDSLPVTKNEPDGPISSNQAQWSPDGKWLAFVQTDASNVRQRSLLVPGDPSYPEVKEVRFARVGGVISSLRVGVADAKASEIRWLAIPEPAEGFYLGQVSWAGNSHELLVEKLSRFRNEREFLIANVYTGAIRRIFHEKDPAWVVASYGVNSGLSWINDHSQFIVVSEKDGWRRAYLYSREGKELRCLTQEKVDIIRKAVVDEARGWFYYYASPDNGTQKYLYRASLDGKSKPQRVTPTDQPGTHDYNFSPDPKWAFHTYSTFDTPPVTDLVRLSDHKSMKVLEDNSELKKKIKSLITQPTEFLQIKIDSGVVMDAWMIKPPDFDPAKKYPVFIYVYGEPHGQTVLDAWGRAQAEFHRVIAELGYLVVSIDNQGTPAPKGAAWRRAIFRSLGPLSTDQQAAGIKQLALMRPYVDETRVGIWGWSGGGSNTLNAMFRKPDVYNVGIAVAPKPQPHLYNAWFQEIYMETRETNPEGYQKSAPINFAEGLKGNLLIIHGTGETNTHIQITEGLVDRLVELGKRFDYMAYPHRDHGLREGKGTVVHLRTLIARYLLEHLPPGAM